MNSCELCAKRGICTRDTGIMFGGCNVDFKPITTTMNGKTMRTGYYLSTEGWKPCYIKSKQVVYGEEYVTIVTKKNNEELTLKAWKVKGD